MNHLGRALTEYDDPPVNVLFVYNCNPAATVPDQRRVLRGLERDDLFTVVFEQVMTDTALYADVVLPATTFLEGYDFAKAYGPITMDLARPVIDAVGEARPNADVFGELCTRLGLLARRRAGRRARTDRARARLAARRRSATDLRAGTLARAAVRRRADSVRRRVSEYAGPQSQSLSRGARRERAAGPVSRSSRIREPSRYPLTLISPASERTISSTLGELPRPDVKLLDASRRCGRTRTGGRRPRPRLQRARRGALHV